MSLSYFKLKKCYFPFLLKFIPKSLNPFLWAFIFFIGLLPLSLTYSQNRWFSMPSFWEVGGEGMAFNIEAFDMNKDNNLDVVVGNWNDTYVYYGGEGILDDTIDITYTGRMLAVCDYNGDGNEDMIAMHFTNYDSTRFDYDGEILFYWGSDTAVVAIDTIADHSIPLPTLFPTIEQFTVGTGKVGIEKGDLNNDGKTDLVFSSFRYDISKGKIYVYMGKNVPVDTADFKLFGLYSRANYGTYFQIGNVNADDFDDLLISSNKARTIGIAKDSINYLHIFYGSENFSAIQGNESEIYTSFVNPDDSTAEWFVRRFSVDDINGDGIDDLAVGRSGYSYPHKTTVHYGSINGIDTIPSFTFIQDTTTNLFFSAGGVTQNIGDYNDDGYDDIIMSPSGWQVFTLHFGGPNVNNVNRYGARGYTNGNQVFPQKGVNMGDQTNDGVNDIAVIAISGNANRNGYVLMLYGQDIPTEVKEEILSPQEFNLYQNFPNPFNPSTVISWQLVVGSDVKLIIYDILGEGIAVLVDEEKSAGKYEIKFNAEKYNLSSGIYFYKLRAGDYVDTKKMILLK